MPFSQGIRSGQDCYQSPKSALIDIQIRIGCLAMIKLFVALNHKNIKRFHCIGLFISGRVAQAEVMRPLGK